MAYLPKLNPTVGKGLGGFPERAASGGLSANVGDVILTASVMAEPKWLPADGRAVVEADYHDLFTAFGESLDNYTSNPTITPSTLPTGTGYGVAFSPDGNYLSVAHNTTPFVTIYRRDGDTFTKLANPSTLPTGTGRGVAFSPDGNYLSVAHYTTPYITIYNRLDGVPLRFIIPNLSFALQGVYTPTVLRDPYMRVKL